MKNPKRVPAYLILLICSFPTKPFIMGPLTFCLYFSKHCSVSLPALFLESKIRFWNLDSYSLNSSSSLPPPPQCRQKSVVKVLDMKELLRATC